MCRLTGQKLLVETPGIYKSPGMQAYIQQELHRPCKRWVVDVLNGSREASEVRLRTGEFVLLPDTERVNRYGKGVGWEYTKAGKGYGGVKAGQDWECVKAGQGWRCPQGPAASEQDENACPRFLVGCKKGGCGLQWAQLRQCGPAKGPRQLRLYQGHHWREGGWQGYLYTDPNAEQGPAWHWREREPRPNAHATAHATAPLCTRDAGPGPRPREPVEHVNWLAIASEPGLRSLRDLRGRHLPMLRRMLLLSKSKIHAETGVPPEEIMAYIHYPPSVYQLHVHFAYPYAQYNQRDVFRIHSLDSVINNLEIDPDYYVKSTLQVSLGRNSLLHQICRGSEIPHQTCRGGETGLQETDGRAQGDPSRRRKST